MKHRFEVLDIFRGVFASMVVFFHMRFLTDTPLINNSFIDNADVFVDFFFVLSGFVITYSNEYLSNDHELNNFYKKRFLRIYPLHIILLLVFVLVESSKSILGAYVHINQPVNPNNNIYSFFTNLFLLNSVKSFHISDVTWNLPSWSISAEMIAYLVFGGLVFLLNKLGIIRQKVLVYLGVIALCGGGIFIITQHIQFQYTYNYGFLRGLIGFFTGAVCYHAFNRLSGFLYRLPVAVFHVMEVAMIALIPVLVCCGDVFKPMGYVYDAIFFLAILIFSVERGVLSTLVKKSSFLKKTGKYSYSIYMTHALLLSLFNIVFIRVLKFPPSSYSYLLFLNYFIIFKVSEWTYNNIEVRFMSRKSTFFPTEPKQGKATGQLGLPDVRV